jgi:lysophospholipase L1-like esterase
MDMTDPTRREFLAATGGTLGLAAWPARATPAQSQELPPGPTVLFQGDSITDCGRVRSVREPNTGNGLGTGYPLLVASAALRADPARWFQFFNRGISGDKVPDLQARWEADALALKPDFLSILVGVNDYWHKRNAGYAGTVADYESGCTALLESTRKALPNVKLVVLEPFVLRHGAVDATWFPEFDERRAVAARVAKRVDALFVPLQAAFDELAAKAPPAHWASDGVHPTPAGHWVIAERWRAAVAI